ncbi:MAG TPA: hypothetical protein VK209_11750 [Candidatus Sulfotelmatobacter sp.]|nr:hypothetical protein [Candidatus Sulfotelmatobacter sp.]
MQDDSYGSSGAQTAISVGPAPATSTDNQQEIIIPDNQTFTLLVLLIALQVGLIIVFSARAAT